MNDDTLGIRKLAVAVIEQSISDLRAKSPCVKCGKNGKCEITTCYSLKNWRHLHADAELFFKGEGFEVFCNMIDFKGGYVKKLRKAIFKNVKPKFY